MNIYRAEEIIKSKGYIDVDYEGKSVWIEDINREDESALVKPINGEISIQVPLAELKETKTKL